MASLKMSRLDLECGGLRRSSAVSDDDDKGSVRFSEGDEGSCYSQFYSTADGSNDDYNFGPEIAQVLDSRRVSSVAESDCSVDIENGVYEVKVLLGKVERDCRICHLTLEMDGRNQESGSGIAIELGCSCRNDLAAAHKHCAETWFKIKGNKTCEICNSIAHNVVSPNDIESAQQTSKTNAMAANAASAPVSSTTETRTCLYGHRLLNFLLACMVFAFVVSWLFHFNIPS